MAQLRPDFVLATFNPADRSVAGYKAGFQTAMGNLLAGLGQHRPRHILMASSTRVFAEANGGWVDEGSALTADDPWALEIIAAERRLLDSGHNASVVRFAGIYGIPGGRLLSRIRRGELCPRMPVSYTNRIHREDCAGFLAHLSRLAEAGKTLLPVYIGVDDLPAPRYEVESWLASEMGLEDLVAGQSVAGDDPTRHNTAGHKRCRNTALHDSGYQLIYPDYKSGYGALLASH
jgi:nucleoside-diphosphate-sugar epimerase